MGMVAACLGLAGSGCSSGGAWISESGDLSAIKASCEQSADFALGFDQCQHPWGEYNPDLGAPRRRLSFAGKYSPGQPLCLLHFRLVQPVRKTRMVAHGSRDLVR